MLRNLWPAQLLWPKWSDPGYWGTEDSTCPVKLCM